MVGGDVVRCKNKETVTGVIKGCSGQCHSHIIYHGGEIIIVENNCRNYIPTDKSSGFLKSRPFSLLINIVWEDCNISP